jgi:hypothetical protein
VNLTVIFRETALRNLARLRGEDKDAFAQVRSAITALADDRRPVARSRGGQQASTACTRAVPGSCTR